MPTSELDRAVSGFRRALLARERGASSEMVRVYGNSWKRLQGDIDRITKELTRVAPDDRMRLILQLQRARELRAQTEQELKKFADYASARIRYQQERAISAASREAGEMIRAAVGVGFDFNRLPKSAIESLLGAIQAGSPVHERLMALAGVTASQVEDSLLQGLMLGQGANQIARNIRKALGLGLSKALVWSRTETLRAYRSASIETYRANGNVVESWIWRSARNERTCAACFAMDGTVHSLNEPLDDHPCGRCFAVPKVFGAEVSSTGKEAFDKQPSAEQLKILGPSKYAAYKDGAITLDEDPITGVVGRKWDPQWGTMRYERSLINILGSEEAKKYYGVLNVIPSEDAKRLTDLANSLMPELERELGLSSYWSGTLRIESLRNAYGVKHWSCDIGIDRAAIQAGENTERSVLLHELLHSYSIGAGDKAAYAAARGLEEGVVEKMQRLLNSRVYGNLGIQSIPETYAYNRYIDALEDIRRLSGQAEMDFYRMMIRTKLADRKDVLLKILQTGDIESIINSGVFR